MGRNYYCEYCDKRLKNDTQVIKKHIVGLAHTAARSEHYAKYKDPETILNEESQKTQCQRYFRGECKFGANCRFSHYTSEELSNLQHEVNSRAYIQWIKEQPKPIDDARVNDFLEKQVECDSETRQMLQIWNYPEELVKNIPDLPPSLRKINPKLITNSFSEWG